jgi:hypothetical protein
MRLLLLLKAQLRLARFALEAEEEIDAQRGAAANRISHPCLGRGARWDMSPEGVNESAR